MSAGDALEAGAQRRRVERAERHPVDAAPRADGQLLLGVLVRDARAAEAQQLLPLADDLDLVGARPCEQLLDHTPTCTLRKRAGTVPWPMWATCSGSPLLQDGSP